MKVNSMTSELTSCETLIMKIIWSTKEDIALKEVLRQLKEDYGKDYARTTVATFIHNITEKGFIESYKVGRVAYIKAIKDEETYLLQHMKEEVQFWFGGSQSEAIATICKASKPSAEELEDIRQMISEL